MIVRVNLRIEHPVISIPELFCVWSGFYGVVAHYDDTITIRTKTPTTNQVFLGSAVKNDITAFKSFIALSYAFLM